MSFLAKINLGCIKNNSNFNFPHTHRPVCARQDKTKHPGTRLPVAQFDGGRPLVKVDIVGKDDWTLDRKSKSVTR